MIHTFDSDIAELVGVNAAIIFQSLTFWIKKNEANGENFHDGSYWTYNSKAAWKKLFPYMGDKQFKAALQKLIEEGLIKTGCYNSKPFDRTLWYALTEKGESMIPKSNLPLAQNRTMEKPKIGSPIPVNIPNSIPDNNKPPIPSLPEDVQVAFNSLQAPDDAATTHKLVSTTLTALGFNVTSEYPVADRGDGKKGRIDIFAERDGYRLAIEIDQSTPRVKSVFKLKSIEDCFRLILLRNYDGNPHGCEIPVIVLKSLDKEILNAKRFDSFWNAYPKRKAKQDAVKAWDKLKVDNDLYTLIMKSLMKQSKSPDWQKEEGKYVPYPATWLNGRRWEDEVEQEPTRKVEKLTRW